MDLSTVPLVVLEIILRNMSLKSLLSVSETCRALHIEANRLLYRHAANICRRLEYHGLASEPLRSPHPGSFERRVAKRLEKLEQSLSRNHTNARFLRSHTSFSPKLLQAAWSQSPFTLAKLCLDWRWFSKSDEREITECVASKHAETRIDELSLDGPPKDGYRSLLRQLDSFHGLNTLHLYVSSFGTTFDPDHIVAQLNCPQLKRLVFRCLNRLVSLGDKLPNLDALEIYPIYYDYDCFCEDSDVEGPEDKWAKLNALKERGIYFLHTPSLNSEIGLLSFVFQYADRNQSDPTQLVRWLLTSQNRLQRRPTREVSLRRLSPTHRDAALGIIKALNFEEKHRLEIRIHSDDTPFIGRRLPETITRLDIVIPEYSSISPAVIPAIIQSLPKIRALTIHLYVGSLDPGELACNASCFATSYRFPVVESKFAPDELEFACGYQLNLVRQMDPIWRVVGECDVESGKPIYKDIDIDFPDLEREVKGWLAMHTDLESAMVFFDGEKDLIEYYE